MKNLKFIFILFSLISGCTSEPKKNIETPPTTTATDLSKDEIYTSDKVTISATKQDTTKPFLIPTIGLIDQGIKYKGDALEAWKWYDKNGENILITSMSTRLVKEESDVSSAELFARHYIVKAKPELLWELFDADYDCLFDLTAEFVGSPEIADLDSNGIMESYIIYKMGCRSDVSPVKMKIIVHQRKQKYALRGYTILKINDSADSLYSEDRELDLSKVITDTKKDITDSWGRYENTNDFKNAPPALLKHATQLWKENFIEN